MRIAVACDHAGFAAKDTVIGVIQKSGHEVMDLGTFNEESVDYPDYAEKLGRNIQEGTAERGILLCGSGVGACIAANKMQGIYAGICHDTYSAHQAVEHDDINVLCLGARIIGSELIKEIVMTFLQAKFSGDDRHVRRLEKVRTLESARSKS